MKYFGDLHNVPLDLHILKLFHSVLCVAQTDLSKGLVLVTPLFYVFQMEEIQPGLLGIVTGRCKVRGQGLNGKQENSSICVCVYLCPHTPMCNNTLTFNLAAIALFFSTMWTLSSSEPTLDTPSKLKSVFPSICPSSWSSVSPSLTRALEGVAKLENLFSCFSVLWASCPYSARKMRIIEHY